MKHASPDQKLLLEKVIRILDYKTDSIAELVISKKNSAVNMMKNKLQTFYAKDKQDWRQWLQQNYSTVRSVWLVLYKKGSGISSVSYAEAVEEALCFGWIDSTANKKDDESYYQFFAKRNPKSKWSKINKLRVKKLIKENRMTDAGLAAIQIAKKNGAWTALDQVDNTTIPKDLEIALGKNKSAKNYFSDFPTSSKKIILEWILNAKRKETRQKRVKETVTLAAKNIRAHHYPKS